MRILPIFLSLTLVLGCAQTQNVKSVAYENVTNLTDFRLCLESALGQSETISGNVDIEISNRDIDCSDFEQQVQEQIAIEEQRRINESQNAVATVLGATVLSIVYVGLIVYAATP